jgi:uncharacterized membrane protein YgcG
MGLVLLLLLGLAVYLILSYNGLARLRLLASNAWSDIDVQLKRRHDLIPNLVAAVKGHAGYERGTLEKVVEARNRAMSAGGPASAGEAERALGLAPHEEMVLRGIFSGGKTEVRLSDLENSFYQNLPAIKQYIFERLVKRGLYHSRPDKVRAAWRFGAFVMGAIIIALIVPLGVRYQLTPFPFIAAALATTLIVYLFGRIMPARTTAGARTLERLLGFEEFLSRVEKENYERVVKTPEMFERYLPFAMAFGVERKWARAFQDIYRQPPKWYVGSNSSAFDFNRFSHSMSDLSSRAGSTMASSPRSSSGSGFSSGGSSGGGSGGGGGGGW